jgi:heptaprenylglyceryl phosphate synthase
MSIKTVYIDTINIDTGEIIETSTSVYSVADEKFFMMMLTHDDGKWIKQFSNELYVLVLILNKQVQGEIYCSLTPEDKREIVIESGLTKSQVNRIINQLIKKNMIKVLSSNRVSVNPTYLHYGKTKDIKHKKHMYDRDY